MTRIVFLIIFSFLSTFSSAEERRFNIPVGTSPAYGPPDAPITIIEFLDYQ